MNRFVARLAVVAGLALMTSTAWAQSATPYPDVAEGKVRWVDTLQQTVTMEDGTFLTATSPQQLANLKPGSSVSVLYVNNGDRNEIQTIEPLAQ
jgi:hypothetical protein